MAFTTINGIRINYEIQGKGTPLLMFAPGGFGSTIARWTAAGGKREWKEMDGLATLAKHFKAIAYDRREAGQQELGFDRYFPGRVVMGGPDQAVERIRELSEIGITQIGLLVDFGSLSQAAIMRSLEVFATEVLPRVRDL